MNQLVPANPNLPAFLQGYVSTVTDAALSNASGTAHPRISIKQNRFRLIQANGEELLVNALHQDIIIVGANPNYSKTYYAKAYDPGAGDAVAPDCFSDNGATPSDRSTAKQALACATCPHNVWGSKITPSGSKTKACGDARKIAVLLADNMEGPVYELRIPPASFKDYFAILKQINATGTPIEAIIWRVTFNPQSEFPQLLFSPVSFVTQEQFIATQRVIGSDQVKEAIGTGESGDAVPAPVAAPQGALQGMMNPPQALPPAQPVMQQAVPAPVITAPPPVNAFPFLGAAAAPVPAPAEEKKTRGRRAAAKVENAPPISSPAAPPPAPPLPAMFAPTMRADAVVPTPPTVPGIVLTPQHTSTELDALLAEAMR